jgi:hypothetical protein
MLRKTTQSEARRLRLPLIRDAFVASAVAAAVTVTLAAVAKAAGVSLEVDEKAIPTGAFAFWTIVAGIASVILAAIVPSRARFYQITVTATALSLGPPLILADHASTAIILVLAHLAAAAVVIPTVAKHLPGQREGG